MYTARTRNGFRILVTALTGLATVGTATAAGYVTGVAARDTEAKQEVQQAQQAAATRAATRKAYDAWLAKQPRVVVRWKRHPRRTKVHTNVVYRTVYSGTAVGGGSVASSSGGTSHSSGGVSHPSGSGGGGSAGPRPSGSGGAGGGGGSSHPAPPPPPPPPAPSAGS